MDFFNAQTMSISIILENDHQYFAGGPVLKGNLYAQSIKACYHLQVLKATKAVSSDSCRVCACIPLKHLSA